MIMTGTLSNLTAVYMMPSAQGETSVFVRKSFSCGHVTRNASLSLMCVCFLATQSRQVDLKFSWKGILNEDYLC